MSLSEGKQGAPWERLAALGRALLDLLFPPRCGGCGAPGAWLCAACWEALPWIAPPVCQRCGLPLARPGLCAGCAALPPARVRIRAATYFEGPVRQAVHRLKYAGQRPLAEPLAKVLHHMWVREGLSAEVLVPVALHPQRERERGFNQAALLARELGRLTGLPVDDASLQRVRATPPQVGLTREERRRNVEGAFQCQGDALRGKRVALVDDVCTTGATLYAAGQALLEGGAKEVWAVTVARSRPGWEGKG
ncbi:MAG: ComF family protein, partial [Anaerolineae bacterium]|nr:ComF family protein [Anaerolineae bacterium]